MRRPTPRTALLLLVLTLLGSAIGTSGQSAAAAHHAHGEWPHYTADLRGTKYSPLDQIDARNFNQLEVAWRFKTDSLGTRPEYKLEGTPLMVGGVLYTTGGTRRSVVALDAAERRAAVGAPLSRRRARRGGAAAALGPRRGVLDRRPRRRAHPLRHAGLPPDRAQREDRRARAVLRQGRRRGPEGRRRLRRRQADRSREGRDRAALHADRRQGHHHRGLVDEGRHDHRDPQQHQGAGARLRRPHRQAAVDVQHDPAARRARQRHVARTARGPSTATPACGRRSPSTRSWASSTCRWNRPRPTTTAASARATTCTARAWCAWTSRPGSASGTSSWCTTRSGITTSRRRRSSST